MADWDKKGLTGKLVDVIDKPHMGLRVINKKTKILAVKGYRRFYIDEEYETRRKRILSTPLY